MWPNLKQKDGNVLQKPKLILFLLGRKNVQNPQRTTKQPKGPKNVKMGPNGEELEEKRSGYIYKTKQLGPKKDFNPDPNPKIGPKTAKKLQIKNKKQG